MCRADVALGNELQMPAPGADMPYMPASDASPSGLSRERTLPWHAPMLAALREVDRLMGDSRAWDNERETVFEILRRAVLESAKHGDVDSCPVDNEQMEDAWIFLIEVRRKHKSRRKRIAECTQVLGSASKRWPSVFLNSERVREAFATLGEDAKAEFMASIDDSPRGTAEDSDASAAVPSDGQTHVAAWPSGSTAASAWDPWSTSGNGFQQRPAAPQLPVTPAGHAASDSNPFGPAPDSNPFGSRPVGQACGAGPWGRPGTANPFDDTSWFQSAPAAAAQRPESATFSRDRSGSSPHNAVSPKAKAGLGLVCAALTDSEDSPHTATTRSRLSQGAQHAAVRTREAGRSAYESAKDANERHNISGRIGDGCKTAASKTREFEQKHQITNRAADGTKKALVASKEASKDAYVKARDFEQRHQVTNRIVDGTKNAYGAAKDANEKYGVTKKIGEGASVAATRTKEFNERHQMTNRTAAAVSTGYQKVSSGVSSAFGQKQQQPPQAVASSNPFAASSPPPQHWPQQQHPGSVWPPPAGNTGHADASWAMATKQQPRRSSNPFEQAAPQKPTEATRQQWPYAAVNQAASASTGGLIKDVPPGVTDAAVDHMRKNPQQTMQFMKTAAKMM
eukprot:TRINITY_DN38510_c0_g1_i1.p1 TRINITY_DN38510_c0_g1~~TRINITY_DN38510_c0_g1_i1.p1  ORF type:complete len:625 (-),score=116.81 TRINITY_DN38510_c0_g1_i1:124-1998(-)